MAAASNISRSTDFAKQASQCRATALDRSIDLIGALDRPSCRRLPPVVSLPCDAAFRAAMADRQVHRRRCSFVCDCCPHPTSRTLAFSRVWPCQCAGLVRWTGADPRTGAAGARRTAGPVGRQRLLPDRRPVAGGQRRPVGPTQADWPGSVRAGARLHLGLVPVGVGLDGWQLLPRLFALALLGAWLFLPWWRRGTFRIGWTGTVLCLLVAAAPPLLGLGTAQQRFERHAEVPAQQTAADSPADRGAGAPADGDWIHYGRTLDGSRFSPVAQLTAPNVDQLQPAVSAGASILRAIPRPTRIWPAEAWLGMRHPPAPSIARAGSSRPALTLDCLLWTPTRENPAPASARAVSCR